MKGILLFTAFYFISLCCYGQTARTPVAGVYTSLHTYSSQFKDAFSFRSNSASLAGIEKFSAGVYSERRFMLQELPTYSFAAALPTPTGNFGLNGDYSGGSLYNETTLGLAYARNLGSKVDVGVQFHYFSMRASTYGAASAIIFDAGAIFHITEQVHTGLHVYNPVGMKIGKEEKLPSIYAAGIGYDASSQLFIGAEAQKPEGQPLTVNAGLHYVFADKLVARGGISTATSLYYIGFGVKLKSLRVDMTASFHPYLGVTPGLLLIYASPTK
ncbi:MAG TPA: hypothetical protein VEY10_03565 [Flavisolibacter sp.]|nr:hypothetical protein [Flavisolibacter sp.]